VLYCMPPSRKDDGVNRPADQRFPFALRIPDAAVYVGVSRATLYNLAKAGRIKIRKVAGRSVVLRADLETLLTGEAA
jgi:excisionase family DNA binding protein